MTGLVLSAQRPRTAQRHLLIVEDNPGDARLIREMFRDWRSSRVRRHAGRAHERRRGASWHERAFDVILLDLGLPDVQGLAAVRRAHAAAPRVPLVVLTGLDDESLATQALQEGAQDYHVKGQIEERGLLRAIRYAIERKGMEEALHVEQERAQVTLDSIGDAVISTDVSGIDHLPQRGCRDDDRLVGRARPSDSR